MVLCSSKTSIYIKYQATSPVNLHIFFRLLQWMEVWKGYSFCDSASIETMSSGVLLIIIFIIKYMLNNVQIMHAVFHLTALPQSSRVQKKKQHTCKNIFIHGLKMNQSHASLEQFEADKNALVSALIDEHFFVSF